MKGPKIERRKTMKNTTAKTLVRTLITVAILMTALLLSGCGTKTIDLNQYMALTFSGSDAEGTAKAEFDLDRFVKDHEKDVHLSKQFRLLSELLDVNPAEGLYKDCIGWKLNQKSGLRNGDTVICKWECLDSLAESQYGVKLRYSDLEVEVSGLEEIATSDPSDMDQLEESSDSTAQVEAAEVEEDSAYAVARENILDQWRRFIALDYEEKGTALATAEFADLPAETLSDPSTIIDALFYAEYDLDENGTNELVIVTGSEGEGNKTFLTAYGFDGEVFHNLFKAGENQMRYRLGLNRFDPNAKAFVIGESGGITGKLTYYSFTDDGWHLQKTEEYDVIRNDDMTFRVVSHYGNSMTTEKYNADVKQITDAIRNGKGMPLSWLDEHLTYMPLQ